MSISNELKKLAVCFTTAKDINAVEAGSVSEALGFLADNLNVDANGKLLVKEYKEPVEPGEPSGEPLIVLDNYSTDMGGFMLVNETPIDLGGYEDTDVQIVYSVNDGEKKTFNALMRIIENMPVIMEITESGTGPCLLEGTTDSGLLFACYLNLNANTMGEGSSTMVQPTGDYAYPNTSKVTIWSIEKVASEVKNLLSAPVDVSNTGNDDPIPVAFPFGIGLELGKNYDISATVDGEEVSVTTYAYNPMGNEIIALFNEETSMPMLGNNMLVCYDNCNVTADGQPEVVKGSCVIATASRDGQAHTIILNSIVEAESGEQGTTNLLSESITLTNDGGSDSMSAYDFAIGMDAGKQYEIKANVDGQDIVAYGNTENPIENVVMLIPTDSGDFVKLTDNVALMLFDNCDLIDEEPTPAEGKCTLGLQCYDDQPHAVVLNSIVEVESSDTSEPEEEEDPNAIISWSENPYTNSKYKMKASDTPIEGYEEGDIVRIHYEGAIDDYTSSGYVDAVVEYNYFNGNVIQGLSGIDQVEAVLFETPSGHYVKFSMWMQGQPDQETEVRPGSMTAVELFTKMDLEETPATPTSLSVKVTSVEKLDVSYLYASEDVTEKSFCEIPTLNLVAGRTYSVAGYWSRNGITDIQNTGNAFNLQAIAMNISESDVEDETKTLITNSVGDKLMIVTDKIAVKEESDFFFVQPGVIDKVKMEGTNSSDMVITNDETAARIYVQYKIGSSDVISMVITSITEA